MKKIGIVGAGIMAAGMTDNFLKAGYEVYLWNRTKERAQMLLDKGAHWCESPKDVAAAADIVIECVTDDEASRQVWTDPQTGIFAGAKKGSVYIASSSLSIEWTDELAKLCAQQGLDFLDMPLTGSRAGAEGGTLRLLVGGEAAVLESVRSDLGAISEKIYYFGPAGSGMRFKLVLNMLIGIHHVNAAAQAVALAEQAGLDIRAVQEALFDGNMGPASPATNMLINNMNMPDEQVNFAVQWLAKDLGYAQSMAKNYGLDLDLLNATKADYDQARDNGLAEQDLTKIIRLYRKS